MNLESKEGRSVAILFRDGLNLPRALVNESEVLRNAGVDGEM